MGEMENDRSPEARRAHDRRQIRSYQLRIEPALAERIADGQLTSARQEDPDGRRHG
jgi:hypothetical protein